MIQKRYETFINFFWLLDFGHEERDTQFWLCWLFLHRPSVNSPSEISVRVRISTHWPNKRAAHPEDHDWTSLAQVRISTNCFFFKNHQNSSPSLPGMTSFTTQSHFLSGVFIMTFVIVTFSAHERELHSMCAPAPAQSRIVLSLTKPNDKI